MPEVAQSTTTPPTAPEFVFGEVCTRVAPGFRYYHVSAPCTHETIPQTFGELGGRLRDTLSGSMAPLGSCEIARYIDAIPGTTWTLISGHRLDSQSPEVPGSADVCDLEPFPCAAMVYQGSIGHIGEAIGHLTRTMRERGLELGSEYREHYFHWEGPDSADNVMLLQFGVKGPVPDEERDATFGPVRAHTLPGFRLLSTWCQTTMENMHRDMDDAMAKLFAAHRESGVWAQGPLAMIYTGVGGAEGFRLEIGLPVPDDTAPAGEATVRDMPTRRVASLVYTGGLAYIGRAHDTLMEGTRDLGLECAGEYSEWYHAFDGPGAPTNVTQVITTVR